MLFAGALLLVLEQVDVLQDCPVLVRPCLRLCNDLLLLHNSFKLP